MSTQKFYARYVQTQIQNDKPKPQHWQSLAQLNESKLLLQFSLVSQLSYRYFVYKQQKYLP